MSDEHCPDLTPSITESEVWRQAYNAALTGTIVGDVDSTAEQFDEISCRQADLALASYLERGPR